MSRRGMLGNGFRSDMLGNVEFNMATNEAFLINWDGEAKPYSMVMILVVSALHQKSSYNTKRIS